MSELPATLSTREAAKILGRSAKWIANACRDGRLQGRKPFGKGPWVVLAESVYGSIDVKLGEPVPRSDRLTEDDVRRHQRIAASLGCKPAPEERLTPEDLRRAERITASLRHYRKPGIGRPLRQREAV